jgi:hypothetical protein
LRIVVSRLDRIQHRILSGEKGSATRRLWWHHGESDAEARLKNRLAAPKQEGNHLVINISSKIFDQRKIGFPTVKDSFLSVLSALSRPAVSLLWNGSLESKDLREEADLWSGGNLSQSDTQRRSPRSLFLFC